MTAVYRAVMAELDSTEELKVECLLQKHRCVSIIGMKIMAELGFITLNDGIIKKGVIKRCQLEDSPLYVSSQQERKRREAIYRENLRLSQYELLRG